MLRRLALEDSFAGQALFGAGVISLLLGIAASLS
jgi:hypothetical protein